MTLPETLLTPEPGQHIRLAVQKEVVFKAYYPERLEKAREKFDREVEAFHFFTLRQVPFVPEFLKSAIDGNICWLAMRNGGTTLADWFEKTPVSAWDPAFDQLLRIDTWLYRNRVNYLQSSPKDMLIDDAGTVRIIDFEYTFLGEPFEQFLIERLDHDRLRALAPDRANAIREQAHARKKESHRFFYRTLRNGVLRRLGKSRVQKSVQRAP